MRGPFLAESSDVALPIDEVNPEPKRHMLGEDLVMGFRRSRKPPTETGTTDCFQLFCSFVRRLKRLRSRPGLRSPS